MRHAPFKNLSWSIAHAHNIISTAPSVFLFSYLKVYKSLILPNSCIVCLVRLSSMSVAVANSAPDFIWSCQSWVMSGHGSLLMENPSEYMQLTGIRDTYMTLHCAWCVFVNLSELYCCLDRAHWVVCAQNRYDLCVFCAYAIPRQASHMINQSINL